jgi:lipase
MELNLHEWGDPSAPPVVCLHGVNAHGRRFRRLAEERLAGRFRVLAPDLRGHGNSEWEPPWTFATHAHDVIETLDAAGVRNAQWVGHSFGGRLVLELAALTPDRVERAVLLDPAIQLLPHVGFDFAERERADRAFDSVEDAIAERVATGVPTPREHLEEEMREHLVRHSDGRWPPETLRARTLLVHAGEFGLVREDQIDAYRAALGDLVEVVEVPGGHIVYWDAYEETADAVERFLQDSRAQ